MKVFPIEAGSVVKSLAGRDEGRLFVVISEIDSDFVMVANGELRGMDHQKKKRRKHLKPTGVIIDELRCRLSQGMPVENHEVRAWLKREEK